MNLGLLGTFGNNLKVYFIQTIPILKMILKPKRVNIPLDGSETNIVIQSNGNWSVSQNIIQWNIGVGYIYVTPSSGEGNAVVEISSDSNNRRSRTQDVEFVATDNNGKTRIKNLTVHQYGVYDGKFATTISSEYDFIIDGSTAKSVFDPTINLVVDGGIAN